jgi:hypothetical protein
MYSYEMYIDFLSVNIRDIYIYIYVFLITFYGKGYLIYMLINRIKSFFQTIFKTYYLY